MFIKPEARQLYERIACSTASKIADGRYVIGERLPAERHLAQTYSVSRPTIRGAMLALELDGLVEVRLGSGVHVTARTPMSGMPAESDMGHSSCCRRAARSRVRCAHWRRTGSAGRT
jgi:DNA-binding FadR family transcriptional regulator